MTEYTTADIMTTLLCAQIEDGDVVFHGVASHMPAVAMALAARTKKNITRLNIPGGIDSDILSLSADSTAGGSLFAEASGFLPLAEVFDLSMRGRLDVAFLSGIQFDRHCNINASVIGDFKRPKVRMPGGAGSAVLLPTSKKPVLWRSKHDKRTFVERVDFVTSNANFHCIVTPLCVFGARDGGLYVKSINPGVTLSELIENTGFELDLEGVAESPAPTDEELSLLAQIDPNNLRASEF